MGRKKTEQTLAIEAILAADIARGKRTSSTKIAEMFGISGARVREIRSAYESELERAKAQRVLDAKRSSQPASAPTPVADPRAATRPLQLTPADLDAPVVVGLRGMRPDLSLVPLDPDLAMWLSMPVERWARDDERTLDDSERLAATLAYHSFRLVPVKHLQQLVGLDRAHWDSMLREDDALRVRLAAWRAQGVIKKMGKLSELSEYGRDDIALSAATKLLEQAGGAPDAFGPALQRLQVEGHHVEERIVYLGEASLFKRPLDLAQALIDEGQLQRGEVIDSEAREVPVLPEASNE